MYYSPGEWSSTYTASLLLSCIVCCDAFDPQYVINMQTAYMDAVGCCNIPSQNCIDMVFGSLIPRPGLGDLVTCTDIRQRVDTYGVWC